MYPASFAAYGIARENITKKPSYAAVDLDLLQKLVEESKCDYVVVEDARLYLVKIFTWLPEKDLRRLLDAPKDFGFNVDGIHAFNNMIEVHLSNYECNIIYEITKDLERSKPIKVLIFPKDMQDNVQVHIKIYYRVVGLIKHNQFKEMIDKIVKNVTKKFKCKTGSVWVKGDCLVLGFTRG